MSGLFRSRLGRALATGGGSGVIAILLLLGGVFDGAERSSYDMRARAFTTARDGEDEVVLILVDEQSLEWALEAQGQSWPWPRAYYAAIADFAARANVASLTFDVIYSDDSFYGVGDDQVFADAVERQGRTVAAVFYGRETGREEPFPDYLPRERATVSMDSADLDRMRSVERALFPVPELSAAAAAFGNVSIAPDPDGIYRRSPLVSSFRGDAVPSLALAAWFVGVSETEEGVAAAGLTNDAAALSAHTLRLSERSASVGDLTIPLDRSANMIVRFEAGARERERFSAAGIIQSEIRLASGSEESPVVHPEELEGRHVMVGFSAAGLYDLRPMPVDGAAAGVEFHAAMLENLLSGRFMRQASPVVDLLYVVVLAFIAGFATAMVRSLSATVVALVGAPLLPVILSSAAYAGGYWMPLVVPAAAGTIGAVSAAVLNYMTEGRERRFIKGAFSQYLSPAVIEKLLEDPSRLQLGGERRELTIFFSDLQGFTSLSEGLTPDELIALLNDYLSDMTDIVTDSGGTVDKFEGDAIIAFWNAPLDVPNHPQVAVSAALECQRRLDELRPAFRERVGRDLHMRIGMNTGEAVVGNMGSRSRFDYTMLGDAVNLAARLEGVNKQFGTYTMISESTASALSDGIACRELGRIAVVGRSEPVRVYEPMPADVYHAGRRRFQTFSEALARYYDGDFEGARADFLALADDPPAQKYAEKCRALAADPPESWNGVWVMESK